MENNNFINTLDFGQVPIRKTHTDGEEMSWITLSQKGYASVRKDSETNQPFAVLFNDDLEQIY